jgi:hypothetical protein
MKLRSVICYTDFVFVWDITPIILHSAYVISSVLEGSFTSIYILKISYGGEDLITVF